MMDTVRALYDSTNSRGVKARSWSCHSGLDLGLGLVSFGLGLGLGLVSFGLGLGLVVVVLVLRIWSCSHH